VLRLLEGDHLPSWPAVEGRRDLAGDVIGGGTERMIREMFRGLLRFSPVASPSPSHE
jgi:hypothetical protein